MNLKELFNKLNKYGIPIPLIRDNKTGIGSISYTFVWLSGSLVLFGLIGKWSKFLDIDLSNAITFYGVSYGMYVGRKMSNDKSLTIEGSNNDIK